MVGGEGGGGTGGGGPVQAGLVIRLIYTSHNALRRQDFRLKRQMQIRLNYQ